MGPTDLNTIVRGPFRFWVQIAQRCYPFSNYMIWGKLCKIIKTDLCNWENWVNNVSYRIVLAITQNTVSKGGHLAQLLRCLLGCLHPRWECLDSSPSSAAASNFPPWEAADGGSGSGSLPPTWETWLSTQILASGLPLTVVDSWRRNQTWEISLCFWLSLSLPFKKQMHTNFSKRIIISELVWISCTLCDPHISLAYT